MRARRLAPVASLLALPALPACGAMSSLEVGPCEAGQAPVCVAAPVDDACGASVIVEAACDPDAGGWVCPSGAHEYARVAEDPSVCLPFSEPTSSIAGVAPWGLGGSFVAVPTDDGRCLWVVGQVTTSSGDAVPNVAVELDRTAPFGSCPTTATTTRAPTTVVALEGAADPSISVQIASAFRVGGVTRVLYRLFRTDPTAAFGVTDLGGGLGRWDQGSQRIVVQGPDAIAFPPSLDLGDASVVVGGSAYVWGCPKPGGFLMSDCVLARFDAANDASLFLGGDAWSPTLDPAAAAVTGLKSGPWIASVAPASGSQGLVHTFIGGFGSSVQVQLAAGPTGPWSAPTPLLDCQLPSNDTKSYCAGPVLHPELTDPMRPGEIVVSYDIGSTAQDQNTRRAANPGGYWPRLAWVAAP